VRCGILFMLGKVCHCSFIVSCWGRGGSVGCCVGGERGGLPRYTPHFCIPRLLPPFSSLETFLSNLIVVFDIWMDANSSSIVYKGPPASDGL
jgi:hypothetical protein